MKRTYLVINEDTREELGEMTFNGELDWFDMCDAAEILFNRKFNPAFRLLETEHPAELGYQVMLQGGTKSTRIGTVVRVTSKRVRIEYPRRDGTMTGSWFRRLRNNTIGDVGCAVRLIDPTS